MRQLEEKATTVLFVLETNRLTPLVSFTEPYPFSIDLFEYLSSVQSRKTRD